MAISAQPCPQYVTVSSIPEPARFSSILSGLALGVLSVAFQKLLFPLVAPDSYQLLLSVVAISVMYAGVRAGLAALLVAGLAKWFLFLPAPHDLSSADPRPLVRLVMFLCLGLLICWLGQKLHASRRRLKLLSGLLPMCAWCKRILDEKGEWQQVESYVRHHSEADFTHTLCPDCAREVVN
jgi:K+-sensing histidine kinase KdpD